MLDLLIQEPLLLLFLVSAIGYLVGKIKISGGSLGVASVLFVGLFFGALDERLHIPEVVFSLGLVLFIYSIGLSSGPAFFVSFKRNGLRDFSFVLLMLMLSAILAVIAHFTFGFDPETTTGIYAGSTTNTPALAGVIDRVSQSGIPNSQLKVEDLVVGYSFTYPMGVLGGIIAIILLEKMFRINYDQEKKAIRDEYAVDEDIVSRTIRVTNANVVGITLRDLYKEHNWNVIFGRHRKDNITGLAHWDSTLTIGDEIMTVGNEEDIQKVINDLGKVSENQISHDRSQFDVRNIFVSNPKIVGRELSALNLHQKYNCVITRIRRGDIDMLAKGNTVLEVGDRIRFVAKREDLEELSDYFGDSYFESSRVNIFSFGLGIAIGMLLGSIEFSLPGGISFKLGLAGGPLLVSLVLGALRRTGPIVWTLPYSANVTLQQIGLFLLLAAVGIRSGGSFVKALTDTEGLYIFLGGTFISILTALITVTIGYKILKMPFAVLTGIISNQPAILEFAKTRSGNHLANIGYAFTFPIALITKIVVAQVLYVLLTQF